MALVLGTSIPKLSAILIIAPAKRSRSSFLSVRSKSLWKDVFASKGKLRAFKNDDSAMSSGSDTPEPFARAMASDIHTGWQDDAPVDDSPDS